MPDAGLQVRVFWNLVYLARNRLDQRHIPALDNDINFVEGIPQLLADGRLQDDENGAEASELPRNQALEQLADTHAALGVEVLHDLVKHEQIAARACPLEGALGEGKRERQRKPAPLPAGQLVQCAGGVTVVGYLRGMCGQPQPPGQQKRIGGSPSGGPFVFLHVSPGMHQCVLQIMCLRMKA